MKVQTQKLSAAALDWAVAIAEGATPGTDLIICLPNKPHHVVRAFNLSAEQSHHYSPSTDWSLVGPIIERENISISPPTSRVHRNGGNHPGWGMSGHWFATTWHAGVTGRRAFAWSETSPLVAAMRCYVMSKLGETVDVPDELLEAS